MPKISCTLGNLQHIEIERWLQISQTSESTREKVPSRNADDGGAQQPLRGVLSTPTSYGHTSRSWDKTRDTRPHHIRVIFHDTLALLDHGYSTSSLLVARPTAPRRYATVAATAEQGSRVASWRVKRTNDRLDHGTSSEPAAPAGLSRIGCIQPRY